MRTSDIQDEAVSRRTLSIHSQATAMVAMV